MMAAYSLLSPLGMSTNMLGAFMKAPMTQKPYMEPVNGLLPTVSTGRKPVFPMADAADEAMYAANPNGDPENQALGARLLAGEQASPTLLSSAPPARQRVSGWRVLDRVLGGETISGGLDSERERLRQEALRPTMEARQAELRQIVASLPPAAQVAYALNPEKFGENLAEQFGVTTTSAGGRSDVLGFGTGVSAPTFTLNGDTIVRNDLNGGSTPTFKRGPTYAEETARFNAENPVLAANSTWVGPDGQPRATGYIAPDVTTLQPGGEALVTDANGQVVNRYASAQPKPMSDADQRAVAEAEGNIARLDNATGRARGIMESIRSGALNLGPVANLVSGGRNAIGQSDANSLAYADLKNWAEEARNAILQSANGVQTEGDALRALNVILSGTNDERLVMQALERYVAAQGRIREVYQRDIARRQPQGGASSGGIVSVTSPAEAQALPPGTQFRTPDGQIRVKR